MKKQTKNKRIVKCEQEREKQMVQEQNRNKQSVTAINNSKQIWQQTKPLH